MPFSWDLSKKFAVDKKIERAMNMARGKVNSDFDINYPAEVAKAVSKDFTILKKRVRDSVTKLQDLAIDRRNRIAGRK